MLPAASDPGPPPLIQMAGPRPPLLGPTFSIDARPRVLASNAMIHPVYGGKSQCDVQLVTINPFTWSSAARSSYWPGSKLVDPPPAVGYVAEISVGPLNSSAPVVTSSAC